MSLFNKRFEVNAHVCMLKIVSMLIELHSARCMTGQLQLLGNSLQVCKLLDACACIAFYG